MIVTLVVPGKRPYRLVDSILEIDHQQQLMWWDPCTPSHYEHWMEFDLHGKVARTRRAPETGESCKVRISKDEFQGNVLQVEGRDIRLNGIRCWITPCKAAKEGGKNAQPDLLAK